MVKHSNLVDSYNRNSIMDDIDSLQIQHKYYQTEKFSKKQQTLRERLPFARFIKTINDMINSWSLSYASGSKTYNSEPLIELKDWTEGDVKELPYKTYYDYGNLR
ncbi:hypothetical protein DERF_010305 [Dermatophagoides farinae]|uniref:Uncharacterized protein n=1 Tax=Dermatophagoides farinae TaxID=6954 RepID=A0A922L3E4_DERFA|nr:hypothetical protein DERF_010305 [Dermatophagoides farinae]